jgi:hypothetical protein
MIVRELEALFTLNTNAQDFKRASSYLDGLAGKAEDVLAGIVGYFAISNLKQLFADTANSIAQTSKSAELLGIAAESFQELSYAAEKSSLSIETLEDSLKELQIRAVDAGTGSGDAAEGFLALGLRMDVAANRMLKPLELLNKVADRLKELPDEKKRFWVADALFGDQGYEMLKILKDGSAGLDEMRLEAKSLGYVIGGESVENAGRLSRAFKRLELSSNIVGRSFMEKLFAPIAGLAELFSNLFLSLNNVEHSTGTTRVTLLSLIAAVGAVLFKLRTVLIPIISTIGILGIKFMVIAGAIFFVIMVLEDLWVALHGGDAVFRDIAQTIGNFCSVAWNATVKGLKDAAKSIKKEFAKLKFSLTDFFAGIKGFFSQAWNSLGQGLSEACASLKKEFLNFFEWLKEKMLFAARYIKDSLYGMLPDFMKKGFSSNLKMMGIIKDESDNGFKRLGPSISSISHQNRISSNQKVNINVNVKSGSDPTTIGAEVSRAFRKELERQNYNAFMGVNQYAG